MNPHDHNDQRILSPVCLPIPPLGHVSNIAPSRAIVNQKVVKKMWKVSVAPTRRNILNVRRNIVLYKVYYIHIYHFAKHLVEPPQQSHEKDSLIRALDQIYIRSIQKDHKHT